MPNWINNDKTFFFRGGNSSEDELQKEECLEALLMSGEQRKLRDFDNHLDDVRNDWRNLEVNDMIKQLT